MGPRDSSRSRRSVLRADIKIFDDSGLVLADIEGFVARAINPNTLEKLLANKEQTGCYLEEYEPYTLPEVLHTKEEETLIYASDAVYKPIASLGIHAKTNGQEELDNRHVVFVYEGHFRLW